MSVVARGRVAILGNDQSFHCFHELLENSRLASSREDVEEVDARLGEVRIEAKLREHFSCKSRLVGSEVLDGLSANVLFDHILMFIYN